MGTEDFTIGVEEEFQLLDPVSRRLRTDIDDVLPDAEARTGEDEVSAELQQAQIESGTPICHDLTEVRAELVRLRADLAAAARAHGLALAAAGSHPAATPGQQAITDKEAYRDLERRYAHLAHEQLVFGCHVHVAVVDRELAIATMNHVRLWLAPVLALSASSPFWEGVDTGYASYRSIVFGRWPTAGVPEPFTSRHDYDAVVEQLIATGSIDEPARIYWDVRPSARFETLELRVADVCTSVDDAVLIAGLAGALVRQGAAAASTGRPPPAVRPEILRAARWRAARYGLTAELIDVAALRPAPAAEVVASLLTHVTPALEEWDELDVVTELVDHVVARGTSADRQRHTHARRNSLDDVVDWVVAETAR